MGIRKIVHIDMDKDLASGPKIGGQHPPDNFIPLFEQVRPSRIEQTQNCRFSAYAASTYSGHAALGFQCLR